MEIQVAEAEKVDPVVDQEAEAEEVKEDLEADQEAAAEKVVLVVVPAQVEVAVAKAVPVEAAKFV